jgi:hypothetical protein
VIQPNSFNLELRVRPPQLLFLELHPFILQNKVYPATVKPACSMVRSAVWILKLGAEKEWGNIH